MTRLQAVLFDVDGTLVDSNDAHARAWVEVLAEFGYPTPFERVRRLIGKGGDKLLPEVTGLQKDSSEGKRISERRQKLFMTKYLPGLRPFPGAKALLQRLHDGGQRLVVATSANDEEVSALLRITGAAELFEARTSSSDAAHSKPDPDIVQAALQRAGCHADETLMVGDTPYDVEASGRAGLCCIALRCGGWSDADLRSAIAVFDGPADLLEHLEQTPLGAALSAPARPAGSG